MQVDDRQPLSALRVIDLSTEIAGPYCTKLLVDAGADVIKLEAPEGDPLRRWTASGADLPAGTDGALFQYLNASKRSLVLDLESDKHRNAFLDLAASADLVLESFPPGRMARLGLDLGALQRGNPALSLVSITPWGRNGPWAERPATEFTLQAATGSTAYRGLPDRKPVAAGGRVGEWAAGIFAAAGGVCAWLSARNTGLGQLVDVSIFEVMLLCMTIYHDLESQWVEGPLARAVEIPSIEPAADGWVGLCTITAQQWMDFCTLIGREDLGQDPRFRSATQRMQHIGLMREAIHGWTRRHRMDEIIGLASRMRIPVSPIGNGESLPKMDHFAERGVFVRNPGGFLQPRVPYRLERARPREFGRAPSLGEHSDEILAESVRPRPPAPPERPDSPLPLAGLRVIDLTAFWAGPFATWYLAAMGADVMKVESIQRPDGMRFAGARPGENLWEWSPVFAGANPGKRDVTLRLDSEQGMVLLRRLIAKADVVIENFSPRVVENFGLGWEQIRALNPTAIMLRMPAFGLDGPWRDRTGFAMTLEQVSGLAWITGYGDMPLVVRGACDPIGGMHAVFALLMALERRQRSGAGELVEVPLVEVALNIAAQQVIEFSAYGRLLMRRENRGPQAAPQGLYRSADPGEYIAIAIANEEHWRGLKRAMGDPEWARDPALSAMVARRDRHDLLDERIEAWTSAQDPGEAVERLQFAGVPAARAINAHFLMPNPQLESRAFFQTMNHPITGPTRYPGLPMKFSRLARHLHRSPPPTLGQHNEEILVGELGVSREELVTLREKKVIGERPSFM